MWIYKITNKINGKCYVGKTCDLDRRWKEHRYGKHVGAIARAFKKWGVDNFEFEILEQSIQTEAELNTLERLWIERLNSHGSKFGYNMTLGGEGTRFSDEMRAARSGPNAWMYGKKHSEEARQKMSAQRKGIPLTDAQLAWRKGRLKGRPKTAEHKAKISAAHMGKRYSPDTLKKMAKPKTETHKANLRAALLRKPTARLIKYQGKCLNVTTWAAKLGMSTPTLRARLDGGWPVDEAFTTPIGGKRPLVFQLSLNL